MAAQVNKKFVIILSAVIAVLVIGAGGAGLYAMKVSGDRHATRGDKLEAEGNIEDAYKAYGRAVSKDQTNVAWLTKYRDLARKTIPNTREELEKRYRLYLGTLRNLSIAQPNNPDALMEFLAERHDRLERTGWHPTATKEFIDETVSMSRSLRQTQPDSETIARADWFLAQARLELARRSQVEEYEREENRKALQSIVEKNPDDVDALIYLAMWHMDEADRFFRQGLKQQEIEQRAETERLFNEVVTKFPDSLMGRIMDLARRQVDIGRTITEPGARRRAVEALTPEAESTLAVFNSMSPDDVDLRLFEAARTILPRVMGSEASDRMLEMGERIYLKKSQRPWIALTYARLLMDAEQFDKAVAILDGVLTQKKMPVSLEAMLQPIAQVSAFAERVDAALFAAERSDDRQAWIARADQFMKEFEEAASADDLASVRLRRAKVAMMKDNYAAAIKDLSDLEQQGLANASEVRYMLAVCLHKQNNFGGARAKLQSLIDSGNVSIQAISLLADTQIKLNEFDEAEKTLNEAIRIFPNAAESFQNRLNSVKAARGEDVELDPSTAAMLASRKARIEGDLDAARAVITPALEDDPDNASLHEELIQIELGAKNHTEAKRLADAAIAKWPDNTKFVELEIFARVPDRNEAMLEWIDQNERSDADKALQRYAIYADMGDQDEALRQLQIAEDLDPNNKAIINERFSRALADKDFEKARQYATKAANLDIDQLQGALFQGRLEMARGEYNAAVETFQGATKRIPHSPGAWSLLGDAQLAAGQVDGAAESYDQAMELRPGDADIAQRYARALLRVGRGPEALAVLEEVLRISPQRGPVYDLWISLQGAYGDRDTALAQRATLFERDPSETQNAIAYYALLLEDAQWDRAEQVLEVIKDDPTLKPVTLTDMQAKLLAGRNDLAGGRAIYENYLDQLAGEKTAKDMIAYGQFLERYSTDANSLTDEALDIYRQARDLQTEGQFDADIALSNMLITRANALSTAIDLARSNNNAARADALEAERIALLQDAATSMQNILDANGDTPDSGLPVHRSYAVVLADLERFDEAERTIAKVIERGVAKDDDMQIMLLRARIAASKDDLRDARRLLDQAADKHPGNFEPFWQRAQLNRNDPALASSVVRDLTKVTQLRPGMIEAWGMWFDLYRNQGRLADALAALRSGVQANPSVRELRQFLVFQLLDMNRVEEAQEVAVEGTKQKTGREFWLRTAAQLYAQSDLWQQAMPLYEQLNQADPSTENTVSYLDAVLRQPNPVRGTVQKLLAALPDDNEMDLRTVMVASRARAFFKQRDRSQKLSKHGFDLVVADQNTQWSSMAYWLGQASLAEGGVNDAIMLAQSFDPTLDVAIPLLILGGNQLMAAGEKPANVLSRLARLDNATLDPVSQFELYRLKAKLMYLSQEYEQAADYYKKALSLNENALDVTNDLAYTLSYNLKQHEEALPYAEKAASLAPDTPTVLDTLGTVYYALNRLDEAAETLERAVQRAQGRDNSDEFIAIVHLGVVRAAQGNRNAAQELLNRAETLIKLDKTILNYYPTEIEELKAALR